MKTIISFIFLFAIQAASGQGYFNQWYFGNGASLDFNSGPPVVTNNGSMNTPEGCASIADFDGNLLFYTNGTTIWNRNHLPMPDGTGLIGNPSTSQSALIVPMPGDSTKYYVFTLQDRLENGDLSYSVVDMSLDNGNGAVSLPAKNIFLGTGYTEKLVAAEGSCGVWVILHARDNGDFHAYFIGASGISSPVTSTAGSSHIEIGGITACSGVMKVSPDNEKIAVTTLTGILEVFDFDNSTGMVSNAIALPVTPNAAGYGVCFSPNSSMLYAGEGLYLSSFQNTVFQYDISSNVQATIAATKTAVGIAQSNVSMVFELQLGPDNKIYVSRVDASFIDVIGSPDVPGTGCSYTADAVNIGSTENAGIGFPNAIKFASQVPHVDLGNDTTLCQSGTLVLNAPAIGTRLWSNGSTGASLSVTAAGIYWLEVSNGQCTYRDSILVSFENPVTAGNDITLCAGDPVILSASGADMYTWDNGVVDGVSFTPVSTQTYTVTDTMASSCSGTDQVTVTVKPAPTAQFTADPRSGCLPLDVQFSSLSTDGTSYHWDFGDGTISTALNPLHTFVASGCEDITLEVTAANGCVAQLTMTDYICTEPNPIASFIINPGELNEANPQAHFINTSENSVAWLWDLGGIASSTAQSPSYIFPDIEITYTITLTAYNANGCKDSAQAFLPFSPGLIYYVPNAFTPDGNEFNQTFQPVFSTGIDPFSFTLQVFNRWGETIFESMDPKTGWDGVSTAGTIVPDGVYPWKISFRLKNNDDKREVLGHVVLVR